MPKEECPLVSTAVNGVPPLRVALPMLTLVPGGMGGSETYAAEVAKQLSRRPGLDTVVAVGRGAGDFASQSRRHIARRVEGGASTRERVRAQLLAETDPGLKALVRGADVVHYPVTIPSPRPAGRPWVQTLLDTQHHDLSTNFSRAEIAYRRLRYDTPARRADAVITISEFCKERIVHHLRVPADRIHVAHLGVDTMEFTPYRGERENFVLYPARGWPHKNHSRLLEAMALVRESRPGLRLVLTGGGLDGLGRLPEWVELKGLVSRGELLDLYRRASCLIFPSTYEGFGLPPLEAMASGCPVAAAAAGSLPEVCGSAAVLFDPLDPGSIATGLDEALVRSNELTTLGLEQVRTFTWERCADIHERVYRIVHERSTSRRR